MKKDSDKLEELITPAVKVLKKLFLEKDEEISDDALATARLASTVISSWAKLKQAERAQEAVYFNMARELASDRIQLEHYIKVSMPDVPLVRVLNARELPDKIE